MAGEGNVFRKWKVTYIVRRRGGGGGQCLLEMEGDVYCTMRCGVVEEETNVLCRWKVTYIVQSSVRWLVEATVFCRWKVTYCTERCGVVHHKYRKRIHNVIKQGPVRRVTVEGASHALQYSLVRGEEVGRHTR